MDLLLGVHLWNRVIFPFSLVSVVLYLGVGSYEISSILVGVSAGVVIAQVLLTILMGTAPLSYIEDTISRWISWSCGAYSLSAPPSVMFPEP